VQLYSASLYRLLGTTLRAIVFGVSVSVVVMAITMLGSGFLILQNQIPAWLNWVFWLSPLQYAMTGMANNEYSGQSYDRLVPVGKKILRLGDAVMQQYQFTIAEKYRYVVPRCWCGLPCFAFYIILACTPLLTTARQIS
jgi:hypothetical protein